MIKIAINLSEEKYLSSAVKFNTLQVQVFNLLPLQTLISVQTHFERQMWELHIYLKVTEIIEEKAAGIL